MEKKEAIREYCLSLAVDIAHNKGQDNVDAIIETAKKLEQYILGIQYPVEFKDSTYVAAVGKVTKI